MNRRDEEYAWREEQWALLNAEWSEGVPESWLKDQGLMWPGDGTTRGIWRDAKRTGLLTDREGGITVSLKHTGTHYPDDLFDGGVIYHYPVSKKRHGHDLGDVRGTRNALSLEIPVFILVLRDDGDFDVHRSWVVKDDQANRQFFVEFDDDRDGPRLGKEWPDDFVLQREEYKRREVRVRDRDGSFKFDVEKRYGVECAVCDIADARLLEAAHLCPVSKGGTDDPRNGLVLCGLHHKALDAGLFAFRPNDLAVVVDEKETSREELHLGARSIESLKERPHPKAIAWVWEHFPRRG